MKTHLKTHKIRPQIGFYGDTELLEPHFGPMLLEWEVGWEKLGQATTWSTVCMLKTHKTHFKTHKIGQKLGFIAIVSHQSLVFGPKHIY